MSTIIKGKNMDVANLSIADKPKCQDNGSKYVWVGYNSKNLQVQTPLMDIAFNMSCFDKGEYPKYSVELSFSGMETDTSVKKFHDNLCAMDERLIEAGMTNSLSWFKSKNASRDVIDAKYGRIVKVPIDKETGAELTQYPKRMRLKIPFYDGKFNCDVYDKEGNKIEAPLEQVLVRGTQVKAIIQCVGLWVASGNYMCQWKLIRCEADVQENTTTCAFLPDSDDEDEGNSVSSTTKSVEPVAKSVAKPVSENTTEPVNETTPFVDDSDSDEDDDDDDDDDDSTDEEEESKEPTPPPTPSPTPPTPEPVKKAKKSGRKAKSAK
jgi:hypothetical protein